jgi:hypothetical protein
MVQTAFDLFHVNTAPAWQLKKQLAALAMFPPRDEPRLGARFEGGGWSRGRSGARSRPSPEKPTAERREADGGALDELVSTLVAAGRCIEMGYGLHFGWAIEGAIGSALKIDASYLSPHVNTSARLEGATKQFGVPILMSGEFVAKLSHANRQLCRRLDSVFLVGKNEPVTLFTWDFWTGRHLTHNHPLSALSRLQDARPSQLQRPSRPLSYSLAADASVADPRALAGDPLGKTPAVGAATMTAYEYCAMVRALGSGKTCWVRASRSEGQGWSFKMGRLESACSLSSNLSRLFFDQPL